MARATSAARRYAEAAFELATRDDSHERWDEDLRLAAEIADDERVAPSVSNPAVPIAEREDLLQKLLGKRLARPAFNLVLLLAQRGRLDLLPGVAREFGRLLDEKQGIQPATVTSATALEPGDEDAVRERLEQMTGRTVRLTTNVDPDLIGGLTVRIGDKLIDGSVRGRLERLRDQLVAGGR